jgi:hypothetical protein
LEDDSVFKFIAASQGFLHALTDKSAILFVFDGLNANLTELLAPVFKPRPHFEARKTCQISSHQTERIKC